jgi:hypothetical protein
MGGSSSKKKKQNIQTLNQLGVSSSSAEKWQKQFHLTDDQVEQYLKFFSSRKSDKNTMTQKDFLEAMTHTGVDPQMAKQMFAAADSNSKYTNDARD